MQRTFLYTFIFFDNGNLGIRFLLGIWRQEMTLEEVTKQLEKYGNTKEEQIRIIRKSRAELLDEIHSKQQLLDQLDYMIHEIRKK